jgi:hypothetical protein
MWRDSVVLSRQPSWHDQKGQFCKYFFYGISIKILIKKVLKIKKILIPEGSAGCNKTDQLYEIKKENHLPKQII